MRYSKLYTCDMDKICMSMLGKDQIYTFDIDRFVLFILCIDNTSPYDIETNSVEHRFNLLK